MGHPGTLPTINKEAVKKVLMVGCALDGTLAAYTEFDRKNYFYPDIPKGYQISQYKYPLVSGGTLFDVALTRIHLEEDTARSSHEHREGSLVDYNRAGVPLMELVTEPVIHDAETAGCFAKELQLLLRTLGAGEANMEKGEMRVEANISVSKTDTFGTKVEVKNLNSFRAVEGAIAYEIKRQIELLENGGMVEQETRGWDENKGSTFSQRKKESSHDYRYFPDPDIPSFDISKIDEFSLNRLSEIMPELPREIRVKYINLGLPSEQIESLLNDKIARAYFDFVVVRNPSAALLAANYVTSDIAGLRAQKLIGELSGNITIQTAFAELIDLVLADEITSRVAKDLLPEILTSGHSPKVLIKERGLSKTVDPAALKQVIETVVASNQAVVAEVKAGKIPALQFLVGQGMKLSKGSADPATLRVLFEEHIKNIP